MKKYILLALLVSTCAQAHELLLGVGLGFLDTQGSMPSQVKFAKVGIQSDIYNALVQRVNTGLWLDRRDGMNNNSYLGYQLGFDVKNDILEFGIFSGPTLISAVDDDLGGHFQFNETAYLGLRNPNTGDSVGLQFDHFSSAGLEMPNLGKDFISAVVKFTL